MPTFHGTPAQIAAANQRYAANERAANQRRLANAQKTSGSAATGAAPASANGSTPSYQPAINAVAAAQRTLAQKQVIAKKSPTAANLAAVKALQNRVRTTESTLAQRKATASTVHAPVTGNPAPTGYGSGITTATGPAPSSTPAANPATDAAGTYYLGSSPVSTGQSVNSIDPNTGQTYAQDAAQLAADSAGTTTAAPATTSTLSSLFSSSWTKYALIAGLIGGGGYLYYRSRHKKGKAA